MKNITSTFLFLIVCAALGSTGCGGSKENEVIQGPAASTQSAAEKQSFEEERKKQAGNAQRK
jgi:hypothetical protein